MPSFPYLSSYVTSTYDDINFRLTFSIPDNCAYRSEGSNGVYRITISLKPGQTQPSTSFMPCSEDYTVNENALEIGFYQPDQDGKKRPGIIIEV